MGRGQSEGARMHLNIFFIFYDDEPDLRQFLTLAQRNITLLAFSMTTAGAFMHLNGFFPRQFQL